MERLGDLSMVTHLSELQGQILNPGVTPNSVLLTTMAVNPCPHEAGKTTAIVGRPLCLEAFSLIPGHPMPSPHSSYVCPRWVGGRTTGFLISVLQMKK